MWQVRVYGRVMGSSNMIGTSQSFKKALSVVGTAPVRAAKVVSLMGTLVSVCAGHQARCSAKEFCSVQFEYDERKIIAKKVISFALQL